MPIITKTQKQLWNEAVAATVREMLKWDGLIPNEEERKYMAEKVQKRVSYKKPLR